MNSIKMCTPILIYQYLLITAYYIFYNNFLLDKRFTDKGRQFYEINGTINSAI